MDRDDARIDALVRAAAEAEVNEARMASRLNAALSARPTPSAWGIGVPGLAVAAFAVVLVATPVVIARSGGERDDEALMAALAFGDVSVIDAAGAVE